jgi:hypothetical protein
MQNEEGFFVLHSAFFVLRFLDHPGLMFEMM